MDPPPVTPFAWATSLAACSLSVLIGGVLLVAFLRSTRLRSGALRLSFYPTLLNTIWLGLSICSITLAITNQLEMPCGTLGPLNHAFTVASICWYCVMFMSLYGSAAARARGESNQRGGASAEIGYSLFVTVVSATAIVIPVLLNTGAMHGGEFRAGGIYTRMSNGICYIAPKHVLLRVATISALALSVLVYMCLSTCLTVRALRKADVAPHVLSIIRRRCFGYIFVFSAIWLLWVVEDAYLMASDEQQARMPPALEVVRAVLFYSQGAFTACIYATNKWSILRLLLPRCMVGIVNKSYWLLSCLGTHVWRKEQVGLAEPLLPGMLLPAGVDLPADWVMPNSDLGDAFDIASDAAQAIEEALPRGRGRELQSLPPKQQQLGTRDMTSESLLGGGDGGVMSALYPQDVPTSVPISIPAGAAATSRSSLHRPTIGRQGSLQVVVTGEPRALSPGIGAAPSSSANSKTGHSVGHPRMHADTRGYKLAAGGGGGGGAVASSLQSSTSSGTRSMRRGNSGSLLPLTGATGGGGGWRYGTGGAISPQQQGEVPLSSSAPHSSFRYRGGGSSVRDSSDDEDSELVVDARTLFGTSPSGRAMQGTRSEPLKPEDLIPKRGQPVHVYHLGSYTPTQEVVGGGNSSVSGSFTTSAGFMHAGTSSTPPTAATGASQPAHPRAQHLALSDRTTSSRARLLVLSPTSASDGGSPEGFPHNTASPGTSLFSTDEPQFTILYEGDPGGGGGGYSSSRVPGSDQHHSLGQSVPGSSLEGPSRMQQSFSSDAEVGVVYSGGAAVRTLPRHQQHASGDSVTSPGADGMYPASFMSSVAGSLPIHHAVYDVYADEYSKH